MPLIWWWLLGFVTLALSFQDHNDDFIYSSVMSCCLVHRCFEKVDLFCFRKNRVLHLPQEQRWLFISEALAAKLSKYMFFCFKSSAREFRRINSDELFWIRLVFGVCLCRWLKHSQTETVCSNLLKIGNFIHLRNRQLFVNPFCHLKKVPEHCFYSNSWKRTDCAHSV